VHSGVELGAFWRGTRCIMEKNLVHSEEELGAF
jgi:hypothetical protein